MRFAAGAHEWRHCGFAELKVHGAFKVFGSSPSAASGFIEDRCFRADGFIIRAKTTIRTNGFFVRAGFGSAAAGEPRFHVDKNHPHENAVFE